MLSEIQQDQIAGLIRTVPIFVSLSPEQIDSIANSATVRDCEPGEILYSRGDETNEMFIVVQGELVAVATEAHIKYERKLETLYPGAHFGMVSLLTEERAAYSVRAEQPSKLIAITRQTLESQFDASPEFGRRLCRSLAWFVRDKISRISAIPFERLDSFENIVEASRLIPTKISRHFKAIAVDRDDELVKVALVNPSDRRACDFIKTVLSKYGVEFVAVAEDDFEKYSDRLLRDANVEAIPMDEEFDALLYVDAIGRRTPIVETDEQGVLRDAVTAAIRTGASDIHIEPSGSSGKIRLRLDGKLIPFRDDVRPVIMKQVVTRLKVMADLDITMSRTPQEGRFLVVADDEHIEFRESVIPCRGGEKVVLRLMTKSPQLSKLSNLFAADAVSSLAHDIFNQPSGLVLVTGPTGSGKTTTLYAALNMLQEHYPHSNIVTIEDPIEYELPYATQIQVDTANELGFPEILRAVLRQDPDILMVGEIRDRESAAMAIEAATTGHFVLSSLHTHTALETLTRLRNLDVPPYLLANALKGVVSQRLVPRLHPNYTQPVPSDDPVVSRLLSQGVLEAHHSDSMQRGSSSEHGPVDGEIGRVGMFEFLAINDLLREYIDRSAPQDELKKALTSDTYFSFARYSRLLLADGQVAPERIERALPWQTVFST